MPLERGITDPHVSRRLRIPDLDPRLAGVSDIRFTLRSSLKLELPRKLPPLHDPPPVPLSHQTWCLRNRVQAKPRRRIQKNASRAARQKVEKSL